MIFDRYLFRSLALATAFTAITLAALILLTQSLKFLELVINSGASSTAFWILTTLALPRFFEVILPLALMIAVVFIYNRMSGDSEITVMRAAGLSSLRLARPAILLAVIVTIILGIITTWAAPVSLSSMQQTRQFVRAQYSALLLREGVFNTIGNDLTVYLRNRNEKGELEGLLIYDSRKELKAPVTIIARRGVIVTTDEGAQQVLVFDGSRQQLNEKTGALNRLDFQRYSVDLPEAEPMAERWQEPDERTLIQLLNPDLSVQRDMDNLYKFKIEIHRRLIAPFLALTFTLVSLSCLLVGPFDRRGLGRRIVMAAGGVIVLQGLYLGATNMARESLWGLSLMYVLIFLPLAISLFFLSGLSERMRRHIFFNRKGMAI